MSRPFAFGFLVASVALLTLAAPASADGDCADGYLVRCQQQGQSSTLARVGRPAGQLPRVQGIPCSGSHLGACIALTQARGGSFPGLTTGPAPGPGATP